MFDWDRDQESTVALPQPKAVVPERSGSLVRKLGLASLLAVIALGVAYEKGMVGAFRAGSALNVAMFAPSGPLPGPVAVPEGIVAYDSAQARAFLRGLGGANRADLMLMSRHLTNDLAHAAPGLAAYYQDAQLLIATELSRREAALGGVPPAKGF